MAPERLERRQTTRDRQTTLGQTTEERLQALSRALRESGVRGQVQIGVAPSSGGWAPPPAATAPAELAPSERAKEVEDLLASLGQSGALVEITGPLSCGRTALAYRAVLERSQSGGWV